MPRTIDKKATAAARKRHEDGKSILDALFNGGDLAEVRRQLAIRRADGGRGPRGMRSFTRKHWTRASRRAKTRAQRIARRENRS